MQTVILVIHLLLALGMIAVILVQRSEGGGLGIGGGGGGNFGVMSSRSAANLLTRTTAILAGAFMVTSLALALLSNTHTQSTSILDQAPVPAAEQPVEDTGPAAPTR
ncbi:preprotein translocase subunit SecG [Thalassospira alkalitolerans]|uniref:Protein-export membrane protein SecG n=1 Tax=Thalassospira alkalitolerans TaxID=1293890 RepID=A0A1Y2LD47_9PROT|nr:preprotein translocase subunit SecG [Thalassospira alkalitolerans]OSQ48745.1 preprotein translocase subunit SecG [Thalassospira alkalitolerans]